MLGLFGALQMGSRSLDVQQESMSVAGNNLANVNNSAYTREQLNTSETTSLDTPYGYEGTGVTGTSITAVRDQVLNGQIQAEDSTNSSLTAQQSALDQAEAALGEQLTSASSTSDGAAASTTGIAADLSSFFNAAQSLTTNPSDIPTRQAFIQSAQQVASQFNQVSSGISTVVAGLNTNITNDVSAANQDFSQIAALNQQIISAQASGADDNSLLDQREQLIEDVSNKVNISTTNQSDGSVDITVGGVNMVSGGTATNQLQAVNTGGTTYTIESTSGSGPVSITGGTLYGYTQAGNTIATLQTNLNSVASQLITQVNSAYSSGYDLNGNTGQSLFTGSDATNIGVNSSLATNPSGLQVSGTAGDAGDNTIAVAISNLATQPNSSLNNQSITQSYANSVSNFGESLSTVNDQLTNSNSIQQMLTQQRDSESGVSVDEESTNLIQFEKAYQASADLITTLNEMLETVVSMKTE